MATQNLIAAHTICEFHAVELSFIQSLHHSGLIELKKIRETVYIDQNELQKLEKILRLHNDLDINIAGIEAIIQLLQQMEDLRREMVSLRNELRLYQER